MKLLRSDYIIKFIFETSVKTITACSDMEPLLAKQEQLRKLEDGTIGKAVADCLDEHNYTLVPGFVSHDLKHVLMDYDMTPLGETRLQAFMLGNGNVSGPSLIIFSVGLFLKPRFFQTYLSDFKKGLAYPSIKDFSLEETEQKNLADFKKTLDDSSVQPSLTWTPIKIIKASAYFFITLGVVGLSSHQPLPVDASLIVTGLFGLSIEDKKRWFTSYSSE